MGPVYARLSALLGPGGALYAYSDDVYLAPDPVKMSLARAAAPSIYNKVWLSIGGGLGKIELILRPDCDPDDFLSRLGSWHL